MYDAFFAAYFRAREAERARGGGSSGASSAEPAMVTFAEQLRPMIAKGGDVDVHALEVHLRTLDEFSRIATEPRARRELANHAQDLAEAEQCIAQSALETYHALGRWSRDDGRKYRYAFGLAGKVARRLMPRDDGDGDDDAAPRQHDDNASATAVVPKPGMAIDASATAVGKPGTAITPANVAEPRPAGASRASATPLAMRIIRALARDEYVRLRSRQSSCTLIGRLRGTPGADDLTGKPDFPLLLARYTRYLRRRLDVHDATGTRVKREIIVLLTEHLRELLADSTTEGRNARVAQCEEDALSVKRILDPRGARAQQVLWVLNSNKFTALIILLVLFGIVYDMIINLAMGITVPVIEAMSFYIMWVYTTEVTAKLSAHVAFYKTARYFFYDPFCVLDFSLVAMDLVMYWTLDDDGGTGNAKMLRMLKIAKGARALRVVGKTIKVYQAKLANKKRAAELLKKAALLDNELGMTMDAFTQHGVAPLLYDVISAAGDAPAEVELAEASYALVNELLSAPQNKALFDQLREYSSAKRAGSAADETFFAQRIVWDATVFALAGAPRAFRQQKDVAKFARGRADAKLIDRLVARLHRGGGTSGMDDVDGGGAPNVKGGGGSGGDHSAALITKANAMRETLELPALAAKWLEALVHERSLHGGGGGDDQRTIEHAIHEAVAMGVPIMSRVVSTARTALHELRHSQLRVVLTAAAALMAPILSDLVARILNSLTGIVNFSANVLPEEPPLTSVRDWEIRSQLLFFAFLYDMTSVLFALGFMGFLAWHFGMLGRPERVMAPYMRLANPLSILQNAFDIFSVVAVLMYVVNANSIFSASTSIISTVLMSKIACHVLSQPTVEAWMLRDDATFSDSATLEQVLLTVGPNVSAKTLKAYEILGEGGLERNSRRELVGAIITDAKRTLALAEDLHEKLKMPGPTESRSLRRGPAKLKALLDNAVRMPRAS